MLNPTNNTITSRSNAHRIIILAILALILIKALLSIIGVRHGEGNMHGVYCVRWIADVKRYFLPDTCPTEITNNSNNKQTHQHTSTTSESSHIPIWKFPHLHHLNALESQAFNLINLLNFHFGMWLSYYILVCGSVIRLLLVWCYGYFKSFKVDEAF